jgi:hypothetical protein
MIGDQKNGRSYASSAAHDLYSASHLLNLLMPFIAWFLLLTTRGRNLQYRVV